MPRDDSSVSNSSQEQQSDIENQRSQGDNDSQGERSLETISLSSSRSSAEDETSVSSSSISSQESGIESQTPGRDYTSSGSSIYYDQGDEQSSGSSTEYGSEWDTGSSAGDRTADYYTSSEDERSAGSSSSELPYEEYEVDSSSSSSSSDEEVDIEAQRPARARRRPNTEAEDLRRKQGIKKQVKEALLLEYDELLSEEPENRLEQLSQLVNEAKNANGQVEGVEAEQDYEAGLLTNILTKDSSVVPNRFDLDHSQRDGNNQLDRNELADLTQEVVIDIVDEAVNGKLPDARYQTGYGVNSPERREPISKEQLEQVYRATSGSQERYDENKNNEELPLISRDDMERGHVSPSFSEKFKDNLRNPTRGEFNAYKTAVIIGALAGFASQADRVISSEEEEKSMGEEAIGAMILIGSMMAGGIAGQVVGGVGVLANAARRAAFGNDEPEQAVQTPINELPVVTRGSYDQRRQQSQNPLEGVGESEQSVATQGQGEFASRVSERQSSRGSNDSQRAANIESRGSNHMQSLEIERQESSSERSY